MSLIKCNECGKELSDKAEICPNCGTKIIQNNSKKTIMIAIIFIFILILISIIGYLYIGKQELKKTLLKDWQRVEKGSSGVYYTLELDFSETTIKYNFNSIYSWMDSTIKKYNYIIINSHQIEIDNKKYEIEFNNDKSMMTITPSLTDSKTSENWFNHDK